MSTERSQCASRVLMIRPTAFGRDDEAAETNAFMHVPDDSKEKIQEQARRDIYGQFVDVLGHIFGDASTEGGSEMCH